MFLKNTQWKVTTTENENLWANEAKTTYTKVGILKENFPNN